MKIALTDSLHARPAHLLVRLVAQHAASIVIRHGDRVANANKILDVLALGAHKGDVVDIIASGDEAELLLAAIAELVNGGFDPDLVPELGAAVVEGIAIGRAWVLEDRPPAARVRGTVREERARMHEAIARAVRDVEALVRALPAEEAPLFEPEVAILKDAETVTMPRIEAGESAEEAVMAITVSGVADLVLDARTRLLDALAHEPTTHGAPRAAGPAGVALPADPGMDLEHVLVAEALTPSTVAMLPSTVTGIVVALDADRTATDPASHRLPAGVGYTSHAAILARSRGIPLVYLPAETLGGVSDGDRVVLDTTVTPAKLWVDPSDALVEQARARREARARAEADDDVRCVAELAIGLVVRVNIGSAVEAVPAGADGIGLLRTELVFAGRALPPGEAEQLATLLAISARALGKPVNVRLFDAGADKPLAWLKAPVTSPYARGIDLLFRHQDVLGTQLRAIARAHEHANVRALLPLTRSGDDVLAVRALLGGKVEVGAMIETVEAAQAIDSIAALADFICIGTNDLAASVLTMDRAHAALSFDGRVLGLIERIVTRSHLHARSVTVCGEMAGDVVGARLLAGLGVDGISVAPNRVAAIKRTLAEDSIDECRRAAAAALAPPSRS